MSGVFILGNIRLNKAELCMSRMTIPVFGHGYFIVNSVLTKKYSLNFVVQY